MKKDVSALSLLSCVLCACSSGGGSSTGSDPIEDPPVDTTVTLYVSSTGTGSVCSSVAPCGLDTIRSVVQSRNVGMTGDIVVELAGGVYTLSEPFTLDGQDSGSGGFKVIYKAAAGEVPVLNG